MLSAAVVAPVVALVAIAGIGITQVPTIGAGALLYPARRHVTASPPEHCTEATFDGENVTLSGWHCRAVGSRRATLVYLHGVADNRTSATGVISRFVARGFDVIAYDSRGHGNSGGTVCTYGYFEKRDVHRVLDRVAPGPIVLMGSSLGAAVALQAAIDSRVTAVVAAESFSDLRTVATERAPFVFAAPLLERAFRLAEQQAGFEVDDVSPLLTAAKLHVPVLLVHGDADDATFADHSRRIYAAITAAKRLIIVPGARHGESLSRNETWTHIQGWLDAIVP
jgi:uncharacterized protein